MSKIFLEVAKPPSNMITFYHDIEQNIDNKADTNECRQIVKEFLNLEKAYGVSATYNVVGKLFQEQPDLIGWILGDGQEVAFHSYNHYSDWQPKYYASEINLCSKVSFLPKGYRSPQSRWNQTTLKTLSEKGFLWNAENDNSKEPYFIYRNLIRLPIAADDWPLHTGRLKIDDWIKLFRNLLENKLYFAFGSHDFVTSLAPEERLKAWEKLLQIAIENKALIVNFSEAADLFKRAVIARNYDHNIKNVKPQKKTIFSSKDFQEKINSGTGKPENNVLTDTDSGEEVLSSTVKYYRTIPLTAFTFSFKRHLNSNLKVLFINCRRILPRSVLKFGKRLLKA